MPAMPPRAVPQASFSTRRRFVFAIGCPSQDLPPHWERLVVGGIVCGADKAAQVDFRLSAPPSTPVLPPLLRTTENARQPKLERAVQCGEPERRRGLLRQGGLRLRRGRRFGQHDAVYIGTDAARQSQSLAACE